MNGWHLPVISFWAGEDLSFIEQMVIRSYLELGADFTLYLGHPVKGIPEGVRTRPASDIMPQPAFITDEMSRKDLAVWSDLFRIAALRQNAVTWVDLDAYALRPLSVRNGYTIGQSPEGRILSGVISLPRESAALLWMENLLAQDELLLPWAPPQLNARRQREGMVRPELLPWGAVGPRMLEYALGQTGENSYTFASPVHYPVFRQTLPNLWRPKAARELIEQPTTESVHIFGFTKRFLWTNFRGLPPKGSWLERMAHRHEIDPEAAPAKGVPLPDNGGVKRVS